MADKTNPDTLGAEAIEPEQGEPAVVVDALTDPAEPTPEPPVEPAVVEPPAPEPIAEPVAAVPLIDGYEAVTFEAPAGTGLTVTVNGRPYVVHEGENTLPCIVRDIWREPR